MGGILVKDALAIGYQSNDVYAVIPTMTYGIFLLAFLTMDRGTRRGGRLLLRFSVSSIFGSTTHF